MISRGYNRRFVELYPIGWPLWTIMSMMVAVMKRDEAIVLLFESSTWRLLCYTFFRPSGVSKFETKTKLWQGKEWEKV